MLKLFTHPSIDCNVELDEALSYTGRAKMDILIAIEWRSPYGKRPRTYLAGRVSK